MSSVSFRNSRKRLHSPDFRDSDSEDELPPNKLMKHSGNDIPLAISGKLKNIFLWISDLPVKDFFKMAIKSGSKLTNETIILDDDDDDEVVEDRASQKIDKAANLNAFIERIDKSHKTLLSNSGSSERHSDLNLSTISIGPYPRYDSCKANGSSSRDWNSRYNENGSYFSRQSRPDNLKRPAILSNPETAIQVMLDTTTDVSAPEADDIEILSESPSTKQKRVSSHKSHRLSRLSAVRHSTPLLHQPKSEASSVKRLQSSSPQHFTANEVVRLQEKAQYRILLEKYMHDSPYHLPQKRHSDVDTENHASPFSNSHFKKEIVKLPTTDFFEKYCKPCGLLAPDYQVKKDESKEEKEKKKELTEINIDDDDDEDELKVLKVIMPNKSRVPTVHNRMGKSSDYFSPHWIAELKNSLQEQHKEQMQIVANQEHALEKFKKERMLSRLKAVPPEPVEPEFPELTPEMEEAVDLALMPGPPDDPIRKDNLDYLVRKDIETLDGLNWLNDRVITTYFELIIERSKQDGYPSIHAFNTFFYGKLKQQGYDSIKRWTRKIDLFSFDLIFVPIHLTVHWCLAVIDNRSKKICYYDSMGSGEEQCLDLLHEYIMLEHKNKKGKELDPSSYITEIMKDIPQQMNGSDCGMFTLKYAEYISRDAEITFNQTNMRYFRRRMVYELLTNQLL